MICSVYLIVSRTACQPQISNLETTGKRNWSLHQFSENVNNENKLKKDIKIGHTEIEETGKIVPIFQGKAGEGSECFYYD